MGEHNEYYAFISYKSEDVEWAIWLQHELEHYHLPASFNGRTDIRQELRPVFRDIDELAAGNLPEQIKRALENSQNLIVICSPQAAASPWVNKEVETFIDFGRTDRIFPFIVEGNSPKEFFPPALHTLPKYEERLGGDASKQGRDMAFVKVVAGMLGLGFDSLWNRYEKEKAEEERKKREEKEKLQMAQSRFIAEKVIQLVNEGNLPLAKRLSIESLPDDINYPNRPYVAEAEKAIRYAIMNKKVVITAHKTTISSAFFVDNGKRVVSASYDNTIKVWDISTQTSLAPLINGEISEYDIFGFVSASPSPDGLLIVTTSLTDAVQIWDINTGECIWRLKNESTYYRYATFSPSGGKIAVTSLNEIVEIWSIKDRKRVLELKGHTEKVIFAAYNSDGSMIVTASEDKTIRIWDAHTGICYSILTGHTESINMVKYSPDDKLIASASDDNTIRIWDPESGECIMVLHGHTNSVKTIAFDSDGTFLISTSIDGCARIWDLSHNGNCINCTIPIKDSYPTAASFSPLKKFILVAYDNGNLMILAKTDDSIRTLVGHTGEIVSSLFSADGRYIVSASWDKTVAIWDVFSGVLLHKLKGHSDDVLFAVFSPNGKQVASASRDNTVRIWDSGKGECLYVYYGHQDAVKCVCYSPDGRFLVSSSDDNSIRLWDNWTGKCIRVINTSPNHASLVSIDHKGEKIISSMNNYDIKVWDLLSGEPIQPCEEDNDELIPFLLTPDKKYIVGDTTGELMVKVWERKSEMCIKMFMGHTKRVSSFAFNPQGDRVVSASSDLTIKIWEFPSLQTIIDETKDSYKNYPLSLEERKRYYLE